MRHAESADNARDAFTGWLDPPLTQAGVEQARSAGRSLLEHACAPTVVHTSVLDRAVATATIVAEVIADGGLARPAVCRSWRLNERHYGQLQGRTRESVRATYGEERFRYWRRSYRGKPPAVDGNDPIHPRHAALYREVPPEDLPGAESLADVHDRLIPRWNEIADDVASGETVLVVAHGNSLRVLCMYLESLSEAEVGLLEIDIATPMVYAVTDPAGVVRAGRALPGAVPLASTMTPGAPARLVRGCGRSGGTCES